MDIPFRRGLSRRELPAARRPKRPPPPEEKPDLAARCAEGDVLAWRDLWELHRPAVLRVLLAASNGDADLAQDLEQDLYLRLLAPGREALRKLAGQGARALRAYLNRSALNLALDHRRRMKVRPTLVPIDGLEELPAPLQTPESAVAAFERDGRILAAVREAQGENAERDLVIFKAYFHDGFSAREIAAMGLGLGSSGVEAVLGRITARIRERLRE